MKALLPQNETERISTLHSLGLLDSDFEEFFDRITRIVANVLDVPIALVSLVDSERQWFKSTIGITARETHRDYAFCAHAILSDEPLIVENATEDPRFSDNPLVTNEPNIRFYIGFPVKSIMGYQLGTLCAIDQKPRKLSQTQINTLQDLSLLVSQEIQHREQLANSLKAAKKSELKFQSIFDNAAIGIALVTPTGGWLKVNDDLCRIVGYSREELVNLTFQDITLEEDLDKDLSLLNQLVKGEISRYSMEKRYIRKDGSIIWIELCVTKQLDVNGKIDYFISIIKDIQDTKDSEASLLSLKKTLEDRVIHRTEELNQSNLSLSHALTQRIESEQNLKSRELELKMILDEANDAYVSMNADGLITAWNQQAEKTFGWSEEEALGKRLDKLVIPEQMRGAHRDEMLRYLNSGKSDMIGKRIEIEAVNKHGQIIPIELQMNAVEINDQLIFSSFLRDITDRKKLEKMLNNEARNDVLTGLPNRRKLEELLPIALARANRNQQSIALLFIDLDGFKLINDTYGHDSGDKVLREVANRLDKSIRATDTASRFAGDEFVIILDAIQNGIEDVELIASNILKKLSEPINIQGESVNISGSIGVALYCGGQSELISYENFIKDADTAMYTAKRLGKNQYYINENKLH